MKAFDGQKVPGFEQAVAETVLDDSDSSDTDNNCEKSSDFLGVSPYPEQEHQLDLRTVDTPNRLLALALTQLEPATSEYATVRYEDALDWTALFSYLKALVAKEGYNWQRQDFYVVEFRSKLKLNIDVDLLFTLDKESHVEATASGGLLKYWYGVPNSERRNLATCKYIKVLILPNLTPSRPMAEQGRCGEWRPRTMAQASPGCDPENV